LNQTLSSPKYFNQELSNYKKTQFNIAHPETVTTRKEPENIPQQGRKINNLLPLEECGMSTSHQVSPERGWE